MVIAAQARDDHYGNVRQFKELPLSSKTKEALTKSNFTTLTDIQRMALPQALAGRDVLGLPPCIVNHSSLR